MENHELHEPHELRWPASRLTAASRSLIDRSFLAYTTCRLPSIFQRPSLLGVVVMDWLIAAVFEAVGDNAPVVAVPDPDGGSRISHGRDLVEGDDLRSDRYWLTAVAVRFCPQPADGVSKLRVFRRAVGV
jgi:hypothetical protein